VKWQLDQPSIIARAKADVKPFPYALEDLDGKHICQRTHLDGFVMRNPLTDVTTSLGEPTLAEGYARRFKVRVRHPGEADLNRHFWSKPWRMQHSHVFPVDFEFEPNPEPLIDPWYHGAQPMSDPMVLLWRQSAVTSPPSVWWECRSFTMGEDGEYGDDSIVFTGVPALDDERPDMWPKYHYRPTFSCRRILVFDNIAHDGDAYPDEVLRAPVGTPPPDGPMWRMRPKANTTAPGVWNPDSDLRFEPWAWPTDYHDELRRYVAMWWDNASVAVLPVDAAASTGAAGDGFGLVTCQHVEGVADPINARLSGRAIVAGLKRQAASTGRNFMDQVPVGWPHALVLDCDVWTITQWSRASDGAEVVRTRPWALFGIYGRATVIV
jgi:hypothetical protein